MVTNLREQIELDLAKTLEDPNGFGLPVLLLAPDGTEYGPYYGQVLYDTRSMDDTGVPVIVHDPVVTLRRSTLERIPLPEEKNTWAVKIPVTPSASASTETFVLGGVSEDGGSIGFIRLYLSKAVQS